MADLVRDALDDDDVRLLQLLIRIFNQTIEQSLDLHRLTYAVELLASASAPFGRIRQALNEAVAQEAVRVTMESGGWNTES